MKMTLKDSKQGVSQMRHLWVKMKETLDGGIPLTVEVRRESRSVNQNAMYHAIISQIAVQAQHLGSVWNVESWKRLLVDAYSREMNLTSGRIIPNLSGDGIVEIGLQTRRFTKEQASEFTEWLMAWAAQNGVVLDEG